MRGEGGGFVSVYIFVLDLFAVYMPTFVVSFDWGGGGGGG